MSDRTSSGLGAQVGADHLTEATINSELAYQGLFLQIWKDLARLPNGREAGREFVRHPGAVMVVPILDDGRLVLERQYRYPLKRSFIEFPAGKLDAGEAPWTCGIRELHEETGYTALEWARAGVIHNAIGYSDEMIEIWFARGLTAGPSKLDEGEFLDVFAASVTELEAEERGGRLTDVKTIIGLSWYQKHLAGVWPLTWSPLPAAP